MKPDAVQQILEIVIAHTHIDATVLSRLDKAIRQEFGGSSLKVQHRPPVTIEQINEGLRQRKPVAAIAVDLQLSRATVYRMIGRSLAKRG